MQIDDLAVIGGGINGAGIARDAAGRGLRVVLLEQGDLAQGTSSASSKLIHGGLRYLEQGAFRLVRESLIERERLWHSAPHLIQPLHFVLPLHSGMRPAWLIRLGLFLYDHLDMRWGRPRALPATTSHDLRTDRVRRGPLHARFHKAFGYTDAWTNDARLVALVARDAADHGADIRVRTALLAARRQGDLWELTLDHGPPRYARALVNATGPWVNSVATRIESAAPAPLRLVQGSHLITRRLYEGPHAYTLQSAEGRVVFLLPYAEDFTLIGTTDTPFSGDPATATLTEGEIETLLATVNTYLATPLRRADILHHYTGVRPLFDDGSRSASTVTRDYSFQLDAPPDSAPLLTILGGKLTTFRRLAEAALARLAPFLPAHGPAWTETALLPGGAGIDPAHFDAFVQQQEQRYPWASQRLLHRLARSYGTHLHALLADAHTMADLGQHFGADFTEKEARHLIRHEWARTADDLLWRRTQCGLHMTTAQHAAVAQWMEQYGPVDCLPLASHCPLALP